MITDKVKGLLAFSIAALFFTYEYVLRVLPSLIVQPLMKQFHATALQIGFLGAFYFYMLFGAQLIVGPIIDRFSARLILSLSSIMCALTIYLFTMSTTLVEGELSRLFLGLGSAFAYPLMNLLIQNWQKPQQFTTYSGVGTAIAIFSFAGCSIGFTMLIKTMEWQVIGISLTWFGGVLAVIAGLFVSNKKVPILTHKNHPRSDTGFSHNLKKLLKLKIFWLLFAVTFLYFMAITNIFALWGVNFLKQAQHMSDTQASWTNACAFFGMGCGVVIFGVWAAYFPWHKFFISVSAIISAVILFIIIYVQFGFVTMSVFYFLLGFSSGPAISLYCLAKEIPDKNVVGTSLAIINMASLLGAVIFQPIIGHILDLYWQGGIVDGARVFSTHAYAMAFLLIPCCQIVGGMLAIFL